VRWQDMWKQNQKQKTCSDILSGIWGVLFYSSSLPQSQYSPLALSFFTLKKKKNTSATTSK
jgi:hypothetical protein